MLTSTSEPLTLGQQLAAKRHSPETYAASIARAWPDLSDERRSKIRAILAPVIGTEEGE